MSNIEFPLESIPSIIDALPIGIVLVDTEGYIVFSNFKIFELLGFEQNELSHLHVKNLIPVKLQKKHEKKRKEYSARPFKRSMQSGRILAAKNKNGLNISVQIGITPLVIKDQNYVLVSMIEPSNQVLKVSSFNDPLTGLTNRKLFTEVSENLRNLAIRNNEFMALMYIDLDNFKNINDQFGHDAGDLVLCKIADICQNHIRKNDVIGRIGGDEFLICFYGIKNLSRLKNISDDLALQIHSIDKIDNNLMKISASIGAVLICTPEKVTLSEMIKRADKLMYKAKAHHHKNIILEKYLESI